MPRLLLLSSLHMILCIHLYLCPYASLFGRGYKTTPKWGIKPPPTPGLAIFDPWGGFMPPGGGFIPPFGGVGLSPHRGGFIPAKGWFYPPKGVILSFLKVGIKPPGVVLRVVLSPIWGWFYAWAHKPFAVYYLLHHTHGRSCTSGTCRVEEHHNHMHEKRRSVMKGVGQGVGRLQTLVYAVNNSLIHVRDTCHLQNSLSFWTLGPSPTPNAICLQTWVPACLR